MEFHCKLQLCAPPVLMYSLVYEYCTYYDNPGFIQNVPDFYTDYRLKSERKRFSILAR